MASQGTVAAVSLVAVVEDNSGEQVGEKRGDEARYVRLYHRAPTLAQLSSKYSVL